MTIRIVLVEDHALFRAGVRGELTDVVDPDGGVFVEIVGEAADRDAAVEVIADTRPDVVLLDVHLPGGGGHTVIERLADSDLVTRFLALSVSDAAEDVMAVVRAGARGYVTKTIDTVELCDAIRRVHEGDAVFSPRLAGFVLDAFSTDLPAPENPDLDVLSEREQEVMRLIARGYTYKEVAARLHLSVKTIETHVSAVLRKLQLSNRHQLTAWAHERRIV
ncbi:MAG: response regulator transcription factor [Ilumatobacter sp.]|uniref:response regulator n=1 Tax=Ilumatobacter sp. TaxID=1967498 RepID=UPI003C740BD3